MSKDVFIPFACWFKARFPMTEVLWISELEGLWALRGLCGGFSNFLRAHSCGNTCPASPRLAAFSLPPRYRRRMPRGLHASALSLLLSLSHDFIAEITFLLSPTPFLFSGDDAASRCRHPAPDAKQPTPFRGHRLHGILCPAARQMAAKL